MATEATAEAAYAGSSNNHNGRGARGAGEAGEAPRSSGLGATPRRAALQKRQLEGSALVRYAVARAEPKTHPPYSDGPALSCKTSGPRRGESVAQIHRQTQRHRQALATVLTS